MKKIWLSTFTARTVIKLHVNKNNPLLDAGNEAVLQGQYRRARLKDKTNQLIAAVCREISLPALRISVVAIMFLLMLPARSESGQTTLFEKETPFQYLRVVDDSVKGERYLCNKDCNFIQGGISLSKPDTLIIDYMKSAMAGLAYLEGSPKRMLFIGMGIGAMPRYLAARYPDSHMDIVEIDPEVPPVARQFFHFSETPNMRIFIDDGARFVQTSREAYDVIFLDACFGPDIPAQLTGIPFFEQIRARLTENGILTANLAAPVLNPGFNTMTRTLCTVFPMVEILSTENPANLIVVAGKKSAPDKAIISQRAKAIATDRHFDFDLAPLAGQLFLYTPYRPSPAP